MSAIQIGKALGATRDRDGGERGEARIRAGAGRGSHARLHDAGWVDRVKEITGRGADMIYDPVGGDIFDLSTKCIAPEGRLLVIGFASGRIPSIAANRVLLKNISIVGVLWGGYVAVASGISRADARRIDANVRSRTNSSRGRRCLRFRRIAKGFTRFGGSKGGGEGGCTNWDLTAAKNCAYNTCI